MSDDFEERLKRVRSQQHRAAPEPRLGAGSERDFDEGAFVGKILLPQLAFVLGFAALIAARSVVMNQFGVEASTQTLSIAEGAAALVLLAVIALLFGRNYFAHLALVLGACLAFLGEGIFIPLAPQLMEQIYTPEYVALVDLGMP